MFFFFQSKVKTLENEELAHSVTKKHLEFLRKDIENLENQLKLEREKFNERIISMANYDSGETRIEKIKQIIFLTDEKAERVLAGSGITTSK